jgi:hypothetical protein
MRYGLCAAVGLAIFGWSGGVFADALYDQQDGYWATPSCDAPDSMFVSVQDLYLNFLKDDDGWRSVLNKPVSGRSTDKYIIEVNKWGAEQFSLSYASIEGDTLTFAFSEIEKTAPSVTAAPDLPPEKYTKGTMVRCSKAPPQIALGQAEGLKFMELAARANVACHGDAAGCALAIFSFFDVSSDQKLSVAEVSRALRILVYAATATTEGGATGSQLAGTSVATALLAPMVATSLVSGSDFNGDGGLDIKELLYDRDLSNLSANGGEVSLDAVGGAVQPIFKSLGRLGGLLKN